jgi:hypothetical protein
MGSLAHQHCLNHALREAVARCPECKHFYCRECITEHDDRVLCAGCLKKLTKIAAGKKYNWAGLGRLGFSIFGLMTAWLFFYWIGQALLSTPTSFHDGTIWRTGFWEE